MRQLSTIILAIFIFSFAVSPSYGTYKSGISYSIPIEYKNLSESELKVKAEKYFNLAENINKGEITEETTNAMVLYSILIHKNPREVIYPVKLGILYDMVKRDRYAKGNFSHAIGIDSTRYEPYFYFGEFYYKRQMYRQALKYYKRALKCSDASSELINPRMAELYKMLGIEGEPPSITRTSSEEIPKMREFEEIEPN